MIQQKAPTTSSERIELIDVIRGIAVFGILFANIVIFSGYVFTPFTSLSLFKYAQLNETLHYLSNVFVSGKFYPIFCMLFGYGFYMQVSKFGGSDKSFVRYFSRRLFFLVLIGMLHQLIWPGDVVTIYALVGFVILLARKTTYKQDLYLAITFFILHILAGFYPLLLSSGESTKAIAYFSLPGIENTQLIEKVRTEGVYGMFFFYIPYYKTLWSFLRLISTIPSVIGLFFMGGFLFKSGFLNNHALKVRNVIIFFILGAIGTYLRFYIAYPLRIIEALFWGLFYMGILAMIFKTNFGKKLLQIFIPVGRMALSCYILQSILCIFIFYGFGLGLFAQVSLHLTFLIAFGILLIEAIACKLWLRKFKFGPIEWIWRCLSYRKIIQIKI
jgi:uncharacterized protein